MRLTRMGIALLFGAGLLFAVGASAQTTVPDAEYFIEDDKDPLLKPLGLSAEEKAALVAFLESLSGDDLGIRSADFTESKRPPYALLQWIGKDN